MIKILSANFYMYDFERDISSTQIGAVIGP